MYIYIHIYIYVYAYTHVYTYIHLCVYTRIHMRIQQQQQHVYIYMYTCTHKCTYAISHTQKYPAAASNVIMLGTVYIHIYIYTYIYVFTGISSSSTQRFHAALYPPTQPSHTHSRSHLRHTRCFIPRRLARFVTACRCGGRHDGAA